MRVRYVVSDWDGEMSIELEVLLDILMNYLTTLKLEAQIDRIEEKIIYVPALTESTRMDECPSARLSISAEGRRFVLKFEAQSKYYDDIYYSLFYRCIWCAMPSENDYLRLLELSIFIFLNKQLFTMLPDEMHKLTEEITLLFAEQYNLEVR